MEALGYLLLAALVLYLIYLLIVYIIIPGLALALAVSLTIGTLTGGGHAVYNYCVALARNVKPERAV
jgi:hypothetical protein